jgi:hypothetical protein
MPDFRKDAYRTPLGVNVYLRSTQDVKTESRTVAKASVPAVTIDGWSGQKVLQKGLLLAKITSGGDSGKVGPFQPSTGNEVQTLTVTGTPAGGTFKLQLPNVGVTATIAFNASAATVKTALETLVGVGNVNTAGGALPGTPVTITFLGVYAGLNVQEILVVESALTGGATPAADVAITTAAGAVAGATDGRQLLANVVGFCNTFLPWQLEERDVEVSVVYEASVVQANCLMQNPDGSYRALDSATAAAIASTSATKFTFH